MVVAGIEYLDEDAELFPDGSVHDATLARDVCVQGLPCAGRRSVVFFPSGRLRLAYLARAADVGPVRCSAGIVYLHDNGSPLNAGVARVHRFGNVVVPGGERVTLDDAGRLLEHSRSLTADRAAGGLPCAAAFRIWLYRSGRPSVVVLASASVVGGYGNRRPRAGLALGCDGDCHSQTERPIHSRGGLRRVRRRHHRCVRRHGSVIVGT